MAKKKRKSGRSKRRSKVGLGHRGKTLEVLSFGGQEKECYGKSVRAGKGNKRVPRIFCANVRA